MERLDEQRRKVAAVIAVLALAGSAAAATPNKNEAKPRKPTVYKFSEIVPNTKMVRAGYYLDGTNEFSPNGSKWTVLWFEQGKNGLFKMYNSNPNSPERRCHFDEWQVVKDGLIYLRTKSQCGTEDNEIVFKDGVLFTPVRLQSGQKWSKAGESDTSYYENGVRVCEGLNTWESKVVGEEKIHNGIFGLSIQTNENQTLKAVEGAPYSVACPPGPEVSFKWVEKFTYAKANRGIPLINSSGRVAGYAAGIARAEGGNPNFKGQVSPNNYDAKFSAWRPIGQPDNPNPAESAIPPA